jgi:hypothetical protein
MRRILCLHDASSSADDLKQNLNRLDQKLCTKHGIELVFIDAPLMSAGSKALDTSVDRSLDTIDGETSPPLTQSRSWYSLDNPTETSSSHLEKSSPTFHTSSSNAEASASSNSPIPLGFDVSIIHLQQIWNHATEPFSGVLGVGQGAILASMLPLFTKRAFHATDDSTENEDMSFQRPMFPGLNFLVILHYRNELCIHSSTLENWIDLSCPTSHEIHSRLHIFREGDQDGQSLYEACVHASAPPYEFETNEVFTIPCNEDLTTISMPTMNAIGRFLVEQKKRIQSIDDALALSTAIADEDRDLSSMKRIRQRIATLENQALSLINASIEKDPPKSLLAVISKHRTSDGKATTLVGGWSGDKDAFRTEEFIEAGGAPCPDSFKLPRSHRQY